MGSQALMPDQVVSWVQQSWVIGSDISHYGNKLFFRRKTSYLRLSGRKVSASI